MFLLKCDTKSSAFNLKNVNYLDMDRIISRNEYQPPVPPTQMFFGSDFPVSIKKGLLGI